jgi:hypothetical protein
VPWPRGRRRRAPTTPGTTNRLLRTAATLADQIEDGRNDFWLAFGATNVAIHGVAVAVELGDPVEATRRGKAVDLERIPLNCVAVALKRSST